MEEEQSSLAYYWQRPWEVKDVMKNTVRDLFGFFFSSVQFEMDQADEEPWALDSCFLKFPGQQGVVPVVGLPNGNPDLESILRRDGVSKAETSWQRLRIAAAVGAAALVGFLGTQYWSFRRTRAAMQFAQQYLLRHPRLTEIFGPNLRFLDKSGTFERTYINAEIRLAAGSSEGSVKI